VKASRWHAGVLVAPPAVVAGVLRTAPALVFYLAAGALAVAGVVEWPVDVQEDQPSANELGNPATSADPKHGGALSRCSTPRPQVSRPVHGRSTVQSLSGLTRDPS